MGKDKGRRQAYLYSQEAYDIEFSIAQRKKYLEEKAVIEKSRSTILNKIIRGYMMAASKEEERANAIKLNAVMKLRFDLVEFIKQEIELEDGKPHTADMESVNEMKYLCKAAFDKVKQMSEEVEGVRNCPYTEYESLFNQLIDEVDVKFGFFAPKACLARRCVKYYKLSDDLKVEMWKRLEHFGLTEDEKFISIHGKRFEDVVGDKLSQ